jgi:transposase-like protein
MGKSRRLTPSDRERAWARYYDEGASSVDVAAELGVTDVAIRATLRRMGGTLRSAAEAHRTAPVHEHVFDTLTPESAYWLGVLMTGGTVGEQAEKSTPRTELTRDPEDRDHLLAFDRFMGGDGTLGSPQGRVREMRRRDGSRYYRWSLRSQHVAEKLTSYGVTPRKSMTAHPSSDLAACVDFWRGCWDGRGAVERGNNCPALSLVGSHDLIEAFCEWFKPQCPDYPLKPSARGKGKREVALYGQGAMVLLRLLYTGTPIAPSRQRHAAEDLLEAYKDKTFRVLKIDPREGDTFPWAYTDMQAAHEDFAALCAFDATTLISSLTKVDALNLFVAEINRSGIGMVASHTFHERVRMTARVRGYRSPLEMWADPADRQKIIDEAENRKHSNLRASMSANCRPCWGFSPSVTKAVYQQFNARRILDPCAGWGDRLTAALALPGLQRYLGVDPNAALQPIYERIRDSLSPGAPVRVAQAAFEDADIPREEFDLAFTSPPYFDYEEYSDDPEQSFKRYRTPEAWRDGFLRPLVNKSTDALVPGGVFAINISDAGRAPVVEWLSEIAALRLDLHYIGTFLMPTGNFTRAREGIYCWRKRVARQE